MANNACIPYFTDHRDISGTVTTAAVVGKTFVSFTDGGRAGLPAIKTAAADDIPAGVAGHDQVVGKAVHIITFGHVPVTAGEDLAVGDRVKAGADGKAFKIAATGEDHLAVGTVYVAAETGSDAAIQINR